MKAEEVVKRLEANNLLRGTLSVFGFNSIVYMIEEYGNGIKTEAMNEAQFYAPNSQTARSIVKAIKQMKV